MDKLKQIIIPLIVALVVSMGVVFVEKPTVKQTPSLGAVASPDIQSPYFSFGGVRHWAGKMESLTSATTTVCAIQSPVSTSTLVTAGIKFDVGSTTATTVTLAKATTAYATTTVLATSTLAANVQGTFVAATTTPVADTTLGRLTITNLIFEPSNWFVVSMTGGQGTFSPTGTCEAVWMEN